MRRTGLLNVNISRSFKISKQVNAKRGILFGHSVPFNADAIIFVSAKHGMQVWYEHEGNCGACTRYAQCIELLWDFADEMKTKLERTDDPTKLAEELFGKLRGWHDNGCNEKY